MSADIKGKPVPKPNLSNPPNTFVIRIWQEWSVDGSTWRGNIEHLESKKRSGFQDFERMLAFFRSFEMFMEQERQDNNEG